MPRATESSLEKAEALADTYLDDPCEVAGFVIAACLALSLLLLLHHKWKHSRHGPHYLHNSCEQWFQWRLYPEGDVCNFHSCSHEMWILFLVALGLGAAVYVVSNGC